MARGPYVAPSCVRWTKNEKLTYRQRQTDIKIGKTGNMTMVEQANGDKILEISLMKQRKIMTVTLTV